MRLLCNRNCGWRKKSERKCNDKMFNWINYWWTQGTWMYPKNRNKQKAKKKKIRWDVLVSSEMFNRLGMFAFEYGQQEGTRTVWTHPFHAWLCNILIKIMQLNYASVAFVPQIVCFDAASFIKRCVRASHFSLFTSFACIRMSFVLCLRFCLH